jgi:hypothetical protein
MDNNKEPIFYEAIASIGKELFGEYLSDLSRKRQTNLLVSSIIATLLSYAIVKPSEATITGIKINFLNTQILPILAGCVCLYFLIIYGIGVLQDWQYYQYQQIPTFDSIGKIRNYYQMRTFEIEQKISKATKGDEEEKPESDETGVHLQAESDLGVGWFMNWLEKTHKEGKMDQLRKDLGIPREEFDTMLVEMIFAKKKLDFLSETTKKFNQLNKLRLFFEIAFPIGLSLFAIASTIWAGFFR